MPNKDYKNKEIFLENLVKQFTSKVTGINERRVVGRSPEDKFFVGKLSPKNSESNEFSSKIYINQIGVEFLIKKEDISKAKIKISPRGEFYFRVNPTLVEQRNAIAERYRLTHGDKSLNFKEIFKILLNEDNKKQGIRMVPAYEKIIIDESYQVECEINKIYNENKNYGYFEYHKVFTEKLDKEIDNIINRDDVYRANRNNVEIQDLKDEDSWRNFLNKNKDKVIPRWDFSVNVQIKPFSNNLNRISIYLINETNEDEKGESEKKKNTQKLINMIFNSGLVIEICGSEYQPIKLDYFVDDYKYDKNEMAVGLNCGIVWNPIKKDIIKTTNLPIFRQYRLKTKDNLVAKFNDLINDPVKSLENIYNNMLTELGQWENDYNIRKNNLAIEESDNKKACEKFQKEIKSFKFEIERFKRGIEKIQNYDIVKQAFILMNKSFARSSKGYDSWRLFQIVFITSLISDVCVSEYGEEEIENSFIDKVDLLYFPTGGGKTEAFLGITVFTLFFDRLRGKNVGTSAIIKYPLRLLSVQQVQRVADILASAEIERRLNDYAKDGDCFSIGYYVGDNNTPNKLEQEVVDKLSKMTQSQLNEENRVIDICPFCGKKTINIKLDKDRLRLLHVCENEGCPSGGELPLYIVDREIYRYIPSVIISTIDKIAAIGYQSDFRNILGEVTHKCPLHGYTSKTKCTEKDECKVDVTQFQEIDLKDPAPTLLIQDELHLVRESLGAFDSHYETFFQYMIKELSKSKKKIKIIGATATISSYETQLYHLYKKEGVRFPCESPYIDRNFYSYIDKEEINRLILGYAPFGKAIINSVVYSMKYLKEIICDYYYNPDKVIDMDGMDIKTKEEAYGILKDYWIFLEYNNVKLDGNRVLNALDDPINTELEAEGLKAFDYRKMTGDDTFQDVRKILAEVENTKDVFNGFNMIAATSMISHGVDADKFNNIFFFGMPGNTAEYIQAYSRVGRKYPGLVIDIMRPSREKDQSYLKNFVKFHEFKDILVEPVPINRWATKAVEKTFPGIFEGIIINYYDKKLQYECDGNIYMMNKLKNVILNNKITIDEITTQILKAYKCINENGSTDELGNQYKEFIINKVNTIFEEIKLTSYTNRDYIGDFMEKLCGNATMTSLRDTEAQVKVKLD